MLSSLIGSARQRTVVLSHFCPGCQSSWLTGFLASSPHEPSAPCQASTGLLLVGFEKAAYFLNGVFQFFGLNKNLADYSISFISLP